MDENKPTIMNIQERVRSLILGISAGVALMEYLEEMDNKDSAVLELLSSLDVDLEQRFIKEFEDAGKIGEA